MYRNILAGVVACLLCAPAFAIEPTELAPNSTMFYFSIPLDGRAPKEREPSYGLALHGSPSSPVVAFDSRTLDLMRMNLEGAGFAGIEATWLIVGGVAAAAAVTVGSAGGSSVQQQQQQQQQQQAAQSQQAAGTTGGASGGGSTGGSTAPCTCTLRY
ncbi:MAG TPA: hypothetical protein VFB08_03150 [Burkholderiales bacterium]|nr:hypothetical protein [Burkholderiales bacterium]